MPIAAAAGCSGEPSPLDSRTRAALGLDETIVEASIASGTGALRALLLNLQGATPIRELLAGTARRLSARAPHVLWLVIASQSGSQRGTGSIAIATWSDTRRPLRLAALVADGSRLVDSDAETLRALSTAPGARDILTHARWLEILGRDALGARFYRALEQTVAVMAASSSNGSRELRAEVALLNTSRLLFLAFLEAKGWLDRDRAFLVHRYETCMANGGEFHDRVLRPLFFGTLNTPVARRAKTAASFGAIPFLNGGLFSRTPAERQARGLAFSDDAYGTLLYDLFGQYRFTANEETASWTEAAVDPEMLGRAFESLMASQERQRTGAFFTPFPLVERVATAGLDAVLGADVNRDRLERLTVLDPACGSGAFLVHSLERIADRLRGLGDRRELGEIRRAVLTRSIFGVDVNATAVWLCELRLWLSIVIESDAADPWSIVPLPNLDRNVRVGDALTGPAFDLPKRAAPADPALASLRARYTRATGSRKTALARALERAERRRAIVLLDDELARLAAHRRDLLGAQRGRDLFGERSHPTADERAAAVSLRRQASALRVVRRRIVGGGALPFSFPVHFAHVASQRGFQLVVGNPPWVRLHRLTPAVRAAYRRDYEAARAAAWEPGARPAGAGHGFAGQVDVAALFVERSVRLLAPDGVLALLVPVKLWRSLAGGGVRRLLARDTSIRRLEDYTEAPHAFDAAVYPSLVVAQKERGAVDGHVLAAPAPNAPVDVIVNHRGQGSFAWTASTRSLSFDDSPGSPWIALPPGARRAFDRLRDIARPLAESEIGRPYLGVKCGCNDAFVVELLDVDDDVAEVTTSTNERIIIERAMLRPLLRGEHLERWRPATTRQSIIWTHDERDAPIAQLPPLAQRWFQRWRRTLMARTDARHRSRWWSLFRTEAARCERARVVWGDVGREPRASVLVPGDPTVPLNTCYVVRCATLIDAHAFAALLNGPLARAWLQAIAEPARGGYRRYMGWTLSLLPIPHRWERARALLAPLGERALRRPAPSDAELLEASAEAYGIGVDEVAPLVAWAEQ